jgi:hypothetical protein
MTKLQPLHPCGYWCLEPEFSLELGGWNLELIFVPTETSGPIP